MKIELGMRCKQIKAIEKFAFDFVGMEFEIIKVNDDVIMGKGDNVCFGIEVSEFENYFELVKEEIKEDVKFNTNNHKDKKVKIINTKGFIRDDYKNLEKYIGQTGIVRYDYGKGSEHRLSIKFDDEVLDSINDSNAFII